MSDGAGVVSDDARPDGSREDEPWPTRRRRRAAGVAVLVAVVLVGGSWAYGRNAAVAPAGSGELCIPARHTPVLVDAGITNDRAVPILVESVALHRPEGVRLESVWILTAEGPLTLPDQVGPELEEVARPLPPEGTRLAPGQHVLFLSSVSLEDDGARSEEASAEGFDVRYRVGPWTHTAHTGIHLRVPAGGANCF